MRKVTAFFSVSLDGYFEGPNHDLSWHHVDAEFNDYAAQMLSETGALLFGRRTYELMAGFWPTYQPTSGEAGDISVARQMNSLPKVVFSTTLDKVEWGGKPDNIRLAKGSLAAEINKLKQQPGKDISAGGSNLCVSLIKLGLLDEVQLVVNPVVIGGGTLLFEGLEEPLKLKLFKTKEFQSGNVLLSYQAEPARQ